MATSATSVAGRVTRPAAATADAASGLADLSHDAAATVLEAKTGRSIRRSHERRAHARRHGVSAEFGMLIKGAVLLAIGVFVVSSIFGALPDDNNLGGAADTVEDITGDAFEIAPIVLIVIVAVLILAFVRDL